MPAVSISKHFRHPMRTVTAELRGRGRDGKISVWHAHQLVGDAVSLVFERIVGSPEGKLWRQAEGRR